MTISRGIFLLAVLTLALPYLLLARQIGGIGLPETGELLWALKNSLYQGVFSSLIALIAAFTLMPGLWWAGPRLKGVLSWALLLPSLLPPLFVLLSFLAWVDPFPVGLIGVVFVQGFMNAGLAAVLLSRSIEDKLQGLSEMAAVMGAPRFLFLRRSFRLIVWDLAAVGIAVFAFCFASFSIPLVIGGGRATNLEVLIYEKVRISTQMGEALGIGLVQLAIMALVLLIPSRPARLEAARAERLHLVASRWGLGAAAVYVMIFWLPLLKTLPESFRAIGQIEGLWSQIGELAFSSVALALGAGLLCLLFLLVFSIGYPQNPIVRLVRGWLAPSTALLGFAFIGWGDASPLITYASVLALLFFLPVFRLGLDRRLESLEPQIQIARTLGANDFLIWHRVVRPQIWGIACVLAGVVSLWAFGEFALGRVMLSQNLNWALLSESLMSSYRIEAGLGVGFLILISGSLLFTFFWRLGHVGR